MKLIVLSQSDNYDVGGLVRYIIKMFEKNDIKELFEKSGFEIITSNYIREHTNYSEIEFIQSIDKSEYDDYLFKLVNGEYYDDDGDYGEELKGELPEPCHNPPNINNPEFDTIVIDEDMYERLNDLFNNINVWREPLLSIINKVFNTNANSLIYLYEN